MKEINASEAINGFMGWLTTREEETIVGAYSDCSPVAELVAKFIEVNNLTPPREGWEKKLIHPDTRFPS